MTTRTAAAVAAEVAAWLDQFTFASEGLKQNAAQLAQSSWLSFDGWYNQAAVAALAREIADMSTTAQQTTAGLSAQYAAQVVAATSGTVVISQPRDPFQVIRGGADLRLVHYRPAEAYKRAIATGSTHAEALVKAGQRASGLLFTDLSLQARAAQQAMLEAAGITQFRRVLRPELSKTGSCGLCIVAADRIYSTGDLMPLHPPSCQCVTMPIIDGHDPGRQMNEDDLKKLYADAGSTAAEDLRQTRYTVHQHGELGPVLTKRGDSFRGPGQVALEDDPARAARMLEKVLPVLAALEARDRAGEDVTGPLTYQRALVERLRRIVA